MNSYIIEFYTDDEAENPFKAVRNARTEIENGARFVVTNQMTNKSYEVFYDGGQLNCADCGADINGEPTPDCSNCARPND